MDTILHQAKAIAGAVVVLLSWIVTGATTGDWSQTETLLAAFTTLLTYGVVYLVPNKGFVDTTDVQEGTLHE